jgi:hypothetical protein
MARMGRALLPLLVVWVSKRSPRMWFSMDWTVSCPLGRHLAVDQ